MTRALLLLRLEGPLQSWGLRARWDVRDTGSEPSKSGIIWLLGAALGYPIGDRRLEALDENLIMGVREEHAGRTLVDFQTITGVLPTAEGGTKGRPGDPATIVSPRAYLQDAAFLVALAGPAQVLQDCREALLAPRWPVYLGRKSCPPTRPVLEGVCESYGTVEEAFRCLPWAWEGRMSLKDPPEFLRCVLEDPNGEAERPDSVRVNPARMYGRRRVKVFWVRRPIERGDESCTSLA